MERGDDGVARVLGVHAREADAATGAVRVAQYPRRDDLAVRREHQLEIDLAHVRRQVRDVQVGRVLLLLLKPTHGTARVNCEKLTGRDGRWRGQQRGSNAEARGLKVRFLGTEWLVSGLAERCKILQKGAVGEVFSRIYVYLMASATELKF